MDALAVTQPAALATSAAPTPFRPSKRQRLYLEAWLDPSMPKTVQGICKAMNVPRSTVTYWLKQPAFMAWWNEEMHRYTEHLWNPALVKLGHLAIQGSAEHMKLLAQIRGAIKGDQQGSTSVGVQVVVGIPRPGDAVERPIDAPRPGLPPARSEHEH